MTNPTFSIASVIDHTLLKPEATQEEIQKVCEEALEFKFASVCVHSSYIQKVAELLKGSSVKPIAVVGFPSGAVATSAKAFEAQEAVRLGALEIDMVVNIGALRGGDYALVFDDIHKVVEASRPHPVKVILETSLLNTDQKTAGCVIAKAAGAAFVKTSTGFGGGGATLEDIALMRRIVGPQMGIKASGGIRNFEDAARFLAAGATRLGASSGVQIVQQSTQSELEGKKTSSLSTPPNSGKNIHY